MGKPERVARAVRSGDTQFLSAAGKAGARETNRIKRAEALAKDVKTVEAERAAEAREAEADNLARQRNEHILSPDGEVVDPDFVILDE